MTKTIEELRAAAFRAEGEVRARLKAMKEAETALDVAKKASMAADRALIEAEAKAELAA